MNEQDALTEYLVTYLEGDSTLMGLCQGDVDVDARSPTNASPFVRLDYLDGEDLMVVGLHRVWLDAVYHIRGVFHWRGGGRPDRTEVNAIGARLDALLHDHEAVTATLSVHSFREEPTPTPLIVETGGDVWLQSGGIFRIRAHAV